MLKQRERSRSNSINDSRSLSDSISLSLFEESTKNKNSKKNNQEANTQSINKRKKYTLYEKKQLVERYKSIKLSDPNRGIRSIAAELEVPRSCLQDWTKKYKCFKDKLDLENKYRLEGAGRNPDTINIEEILIKWVCELRRLNIALSTDEIILKLMELDQKQVNKSFRVLQVWCLSFLKRYSFCIKRSSVVGQKLKENNRDGYNKFFRTLYSLRKNLGECEGYANLFNMDEIPIYFNLISKNEVAKIGERYVNVIRQYSEGIKFSVILCISAIGEKLPPLIVFKGKNNEYTERLLNKITKSKIREVYSICCENTWGDRTAYIYWLKNIFFKYQLPDNRYQKILVVDRGTTIYEDDFIHWYNKNNSKYVLVPPGLTKFTQPLDKGIIEKFRKRMLYWNVDFKIKNQYMRRQTEEEIIDKILDLWYDENFITKNEIIQAFKDSGIASENINFGEKYDEEISGGIMDLRNEYDNKGKLMSEKFFGNNEDKIYIY